MANEEEADRDGDREGSEEEEEMIYLISCTNGTPNYLSFNNLAF